MLMQQRKLAEEEEIQLKHELRADQSSVDVGHELIHCTIALPVPPFEANDVFASHHVGTQIWRNNVPLEKSAY